MSAGEYAKYYFLLRSMMVKLGMGTQAGCSGLLPLDIAGARKLQLTTERYQAEKYGSGDGKQGQRGRSATIHVSEGAGGGRGRGGLRLRSEDSYDCHLRHSFSSVGLEHIVHALHVDAGASEPYHPLSPHPPLSPFDSLLPATLLYIMHA